MLVKGSSTHATSLTVRQCGYRRTVDRRSQVSQPVIRGYYVCPLYPERA